MPPVLCDLLGAVEGEVGQVSGMDGMDMHGALYGAMEAASSTLAEMPQLASDAAEAERAYRVLKAERVLLARAQGHPASLIGDIVKGQPDVADLKMAADCAVGLRDANREAHLWAKKQADIAREMIAREFSGAQR